MKALAMTFGLGIYQTVRQGLEVLALVVLALLGVVVFTLLVLGMLLVPVRVSDVDDDRV